MGLQGYYYYQGYYRDYIKVKTQEDKVYNESNLIKDFKKIYNNYYQVKPLDNSIRLSKGIQ